jgi:hypothetical protein
LEPYLKPFIFFELTNGPYKLVLHYTRLKRLARDRYSSLLGPFIS